MMQPYINPNYFGQYVNPAVMNQQQRLQQMEQAYPQVIGRVVNDISSVVANEVPMDGRPSVFVNEDMSKVWVKQWGSDGIIRTTSYLPQIGTKNEEVEKLSSKEEKWLESAFNDFTRAFEERLDSIDEKLSRALTKSRTKKDGEEA